ncbi:hypothetical protein FACS1894137_18460 [Spirochaetia bacterium]|nr:hypothetical protein FACS1894137_18460 [Spirochaetia bacterium]
MAAIINRALMDVQVLALCMDASETRKAQVRDEAMAWFHDRDFEAYALALEIDPQRIRERAADYYRAGIADLVRPRGRPPKRNRSPAHKQPRMKKEGRL